MNTHCHCHSRDVALKPEGKIAHETVAVYPLYPYGSMVVVYSSQSGTLVILPYFNVVGWATESHSHKKNYATSVPKCMFF